LRRVDKWAINEQAGVCAFTNPERAYWYGDEVKNDDLLAVFYGVPLSLCIEPDSVVAEVVEKVGVFSTKDFVDTYLNGNAPNGPPVSRGELIYSAPESVPLLGEDGNEKWGEMPDIRNM
jgi:hypothetical protein